MPKSTVRKKKIYTPPAELRPQAAAAARKSSPTWVPATAVGLIVFGIAYLVVYYLTESWWALTPHMDFLAQISYWNLVIGFAALVVALGLLSKWK